MLVYLEGTGEGNAVAVFVQLSEAAIARKLPVRVEDPRAFASGSGRFTIDVTHADTSDDAEVVVRAMLDQVPGGHGAFRLSAAQE